ncbi:unnamed protein product [Effrenium voratum]|uniref:Uncharacterized protein n=1 Tax=Effrenium voratum TaxID=2562239 RepID=A0AA36NF47_9DINO|nr:unnamed protein product [Effrenium voratum]
MELRAAGERAQHKSNMAFEMEESQKLQDAQRGHDQAINDTRVELKAARDDLDNRVKSWELDVAHSYAMKTISDDRILSLEKALKESNSRLSAAYKKPTKPSSSSSSGLDAGLTDLGRQNEKELGLREEIHALEQEKQHNNKEMSSIRLELLGLKRENERKKAETTSSLRGRGRGRKGRGRSSRKFLEIIDEEDDNDDLPDSKSVDQEDWASECVSSDCGDNDVDDCGTSLPDTTAQLDAVNKLLLELSNERNLKQSLRAEQAGQSAEHNEQIEQLRQQMTESSLLQEKTAAENQRLKSLDSENRVQNLRQVDGLQVKVRDLEELLCDQRAMVQEQWRFAREHEFNKSALEEKLQMQTEALRITSMRLQDALQQHQNEAVRHQQELNSLKLQLALEKKKGGGTAAEVEPSEAKDPQPETSMEFLEQRVKDLQEERNILVGKLEVKEVQYHLQLDDLFRENASKLRDQRIQFEEQIAAIQAKFELRNHLQGQAFDYINTASSSHPVLGQATPTTTSEDPKGSPRPEDLDARKVLTSGQSGSSTPHTRSVVSAGTDSSAVSESLSGVKSMVWTIIGLLPNVAAMLCTVEALIIQQVTPRVSVLLGGVLIGKSFFSLVRQSSAASFRRTMQVNQAMAEGSQCDIPNFLARTLARYELVAPDGKSVDVVISTAHLPGEHKVGERHILLLLVEQPSERLRGQYSVASSDVCPSDSVSVGRRRPQLMSSEAQRTKLRASFFSSSRQSARVSTSSESPSPRSSLCK